MVNLYNIQPPLRFTEGTEHIWEGLAKIPCTGWVQWGIPGPETVAEHIIAVRQLVVSWRNKLELTDVDLVDVLSLVEVHDWPKLKAGDTVILGDELDAATQYAKKKAAEKQAMTDICVGLPEGETIRTLYQRFVEGSDRNAIVAKEVGLFQALILAKEYEERYRKEGLLEEFIRYTKDQLTIPFLKNLR